MYHNELTDMRLADIDKVGVETVKEPGYVYIGRENERRGLTESPLYNPYKLSDGYSRREAVLKYVEHFYAEIRDKDAFVALINTVRGKTLLCFCEPKLCHGHVIILHHAYRTRMLRDPETRVETDVLEERVNNAVKQLAETKT